MRPTTTTVPLFARERVAGVEELGETQSAVLRHGDERRGLHVDDGAVLVDPSIDPRARLAKERVGRPRPSDEVFDVVFVEHLAEHANAERIGVDDPTRRGVVEARALVAQGRRHDHDVSEVEVVDQRTGAATGDQRRDAERRDLLDEAGRERCADAGMDHRDGPFVGQELVDRIATDLTAQDVLRLEHALGGELFEELVEEAQHRDRRDVRAVAMQHVGFEDARFGEVVFVQRQVHRANLVGARVRSLQPTEQRHDGVDVAAHLDATVAQRRRTVDVAVRSARPRRRRRVCTMASAARWSPGSTRAPSVPIENVIACGPLLGASGNSMHDAHRRGVGVERERDRRVRAIR